MNPNQVYTQLRFTNLNKDVWGKKYPTISCIDFIGYPNLFWKAVLINYLINSGEITLNSNKPEITTIKLFLSF